MFKQLDIACLPDGTIQFIDDDELASLVDDASCVKSTRVSHVERENGLWVADMAIVGGPKLPPQRLRSDALRLEREWLDEHNIISRNLAT